MASNFESELILSFHRTWNNELFCAFLSVSPSFIAGFNESIWNASFCWRPPKGSNLSLMLRFSVCDSVASCPPRLWSFNHFSVVFRRFTFLSSGHFLSLGFHPFNFVSNCFQIDLVYDFDLTSFLISTQLDRLLPLIRRFTRGRRPCCCRHPQSRCCTTAHFTAYTSVIKQL